MTTDSKITIEEINRAQADWAAGIVAIGKAYIDKDNYTRAAERHLDTLYAFEYGPVLFKPTKAAETQFRLNRESALSYFIGGNSSYREDLGFALHPWLHVRFENQQTYIHNDYAVSMGNYFFKEKSGNEVKVEYTFGYIKDSNGRLKINLHHSSIPFAAG